jgi:uncharacterized membrane protein (DUF2068 family)
MWHRKRREENMNNEKPTGVEILSVLYGLKALSFLGVGVMLLVDVAFIGDTVLGHSGTMLAAAGGFMVVVGLVDIAVAWGLWTLQSWARTVAIIFAIVGLLASLGGTTISIIVHWAISLIVLVYLTRPGVKTAFE